MQRQPATSLDLFTDSVRLMGDATMVAVMEFDRRLDMLRMFAGGLEMRRCLPDPPLEACPGARSSILGAPGKGGERRDIFGRFHRGTGLSFTHPIGDRPVRKIAVKDRLLRSPDRDAIVINLAHAAADANGLMMMASTLLNAYLDPLSVPPVRRVFGERHPLDRRPH